LYVHISFCLLLCWVSPCFLLLLFALVPASIYAPSLLAFLCLLHLHLLLHLLVCTCFELFLYLLLHLLACTFPFCSLPLPLHLPEPRRATVSGRLQPLAGKRAGRKLPLMVAIFRYQHPKSGSGSCAWKVKLPRLCSLASSGVRSVLWCPTQRGTGDTDTTWSVLLSGRLPLSPYCDDMSDDI